jgi:hypothetical protein
MHAMCPAQVAGNIPLLERAGERIGGVGAVLKLGRANTLSVKSGWRRQVMPMSVVGSMCHQMASRRNVLRIVVFILVVVRVVQRDDFDPVESLLLKEFDELFLLVLIHVDDDCPETIGCMSLI